MQRADASDDTNQVMTVNDDKKTSTTCTSRIIYTGSTLTQASLGLIGLGAGAMYIGPSQTCAATVTCGKWLADLTSKNVAVAIFTSGGANFAFINAYFASKSINQLIAFESKQPDWIRRIAWGGAIGFFTVSQSVSAFISTVSTSTSSWQVFVTVGASIPNSLYSAVGTIEHEIPLICSFVSQIYRRLHYGLSDLCFEPSEEETRYRQRTKHYYKQYENFLRSLDQHWQYVKTHPGEITTIPSDAPLTWLMSRPITQTGNGCLRSTVNSTKITTGLAATAIISVPFMLNNHGTIMPYVNNSVGAGLLATYFSYSMLYSNMKLLGSFMQGVINILDRLITGRPIDSLVYQLHPYITVFSVGLICAFASLSYALMNTVFEMEFPAVNQTRDGLRYSSDLGIILYHIAGMYYLYELVSASFTLSKKDKFIYKVQSEVEGMHQKGDKEFIQFVESNTDEYNSQLGIQRYQPSVATVSNCEQGEGAVRVPDSNNKKHDWFRLFCCTKKPTATHTPDETSRLLQKPQG